MLQITCIYVTQLVGVDKYNWKAAMWTSGNKEKVELERYKTKWENKGKQFSVVHRSVQTEKMKEQDSV